MKALAAPVALILLLATCNTTPSPVAPPPSADTAPISGLPATTTTVRVRITEPRPPSTATIPPSTIAPTTTLAPIVPGAPGTAIQGYCTQYEPLLIELAPPGGWDIAKMSRTMWRESRCEPWAWNARSADSGLLQVNKINYTWLRTNMGEWVDRWTLQDPRQNIRASAKLCTYWRKAGSSCYQPWSGGA